MQWFVIKLKKLILDHFLLKNSGKKKSFESILSIYGAVTSCKKSGKSHALNFNEN